MIIYIYNMYNVQYIIKRADTWQFSFFDSPLLFRIRGKHPGLAKLFHQVAHDRREPGP